jgi:outer membrane lipoprotein-sorting protein
MCRQPGSKRRDIRKLYFKHPSKVRLDFVSGRGRYRGHVVRSVLLDGNTLRAVDARGTWYFKSKLTKHGGPPALLFLTATQDLSIDFHARLVNDGEYGAAGDAVLELTPRTSAARFKSLVLVVDRKTFRVKKSIVTSAAGDMSELSFFEPDTTGKVADRPAGR